MRKKLILFALSFFFDVRFHIQEKLSQHVCFLTCCEFDLSAFTIKRKRSKSTNSRQTLFNIIDWRLQYFPTFTRTFWRILAAQARILVDVFKIRNVRITRQYALSVFNGQSNTVLLWNTYTIKIKSVYILQNKIVKSHFAHVHTGVVHTCRCKARTCSTMVRACESWHGMHSSTPVYSWHNRHQWTNQPS